MGKVFRAFSMKFLFLLAFLAASGCTTIVPFHSIPTETTDFRLPPEEIKKKYSDIEFYEKKFRGFSTTTPLFDELVEKWGEPQKVEQDWLNFAAPGVIVPLSPILFGSLQPGAIALGIVLVMKPTPPDHAYWTKEDYVIDVYSARTIMHPYKKTIFFWKWTYAKKDDKSTTTNDAPKIFDTSGINPKIPEEGVPRNEK